MDPDNSNSNPGPPPQTRLSLLDSNIAWEKTLGEVDMITDGLGKRIDEKIKESVAAFLIHGFTTSGSCEGHIAEKGKELHGVPYPWIEVYAPEPKGWRKAKGNKKEQLERGWSIKNFTQQRKMMLFLEKFYQGRETLFDARLTFYRVGAFGGFRVQSFGAEMWVILSPEEQKQKLASYRKEIKDFTEFLKNQHFSKE